MNKSLIVGALFMFCFTLVTPEAHAGMAAEENAVLSTMGSQEGRSPVRGEAQDNWYETSFFLLHEDHHTQGQFEVGRDADPSEIQALLKLLQPDAIQIHAKGNPGWTTYPSTIGYTPPKLARDVLALWRDAARANGFHWSIYYNIGRDGEIMKRHPEWNRDAPNGTEQDRALCYHSGVAEHYIWPMLEEIIEGYDPDGFWFDGSVFTIRTCYCEECRQRFLSEGNSAVPHAPGEPKWAEYLEMQRAIYREFVAETCRRVHAQKPSCLVSFNWAYSVRMPEKPDPEIAYLTGDIANRVEGLSQEAHWYDGVGLPYDLMTTGHTFVKRDNGIERVPKPKPQLEQEMAVIIANGGRYNLWDTPSPRSRIAPEFIRHYSQVITPFLRSRQSWCTNTERVPDVSVLHSSTAHYSLAERGIAPFSRKNNRQDGLAKFLPQLHLNYEAVGDWQLIDQTVHSRLLIVEHPRALSDAELDAMWRFAQHGGHVLLTGMGITLRRDLPEQFGFEIIQTPTAAEPLDVRINGKKLQLFHHLFRVKPSGCDVLARAVDEGGETFPLLTRHDRGKGVLWAVTIPFFSLHGNNTPSLELMRDVMETVLPAARRQLVTKAPKNVEVVLRRRLDGALIYHVINMAAGRRTTCPRGHRQTVTIHELPPVPAHEVSLRLRTKPCSVRVQPGDMAIEDWCYQNGWATFTMPVTEVHAMAVVQ